MKKIVEVNNLSFKYDRDFILQDINLVIEQGDFMAFLGPNGSGKSTLIQLLLGSLKPTSGEVKVFGVAVEHFTDWGRIGYISQQVKNFNQSFPATVKELITAKLYQQMGFLKLSKSRLQPRIERALALVDMLDYQDRQLGSLSGGQQQRVFIARTMVSEPEVIFLDEPLVGVDSRAQDDFFQLVNRLNNELGITVVMISHDIHVVSSQANRVVCLVDRRLYHHQGDEFDYSCYLEGVRGKNRLVPEHLHQVVD